MNDALVVRRDTDGVATLALNRPAKRNALSAALVAQLARSLGEAGADPAVRVIALRGVGKDFCAGADLEEIAASRSGGPEEGLADARRLGEVFVLIRRLERPVVALVTGRALGGGCGLATACDLVLARDDAVFGYPEVHLGFVPALVMSSLRRKIGESAALELLLSGDRLGAAEARAAGFVNRVFAKDEFETAAAGYLSALAARPAAAVALTKRLFYGLDGASFEDAIARGAEVNAIARLTQDFGVGLDRFLHGTREG